VVARARSLLRNLEGNPRTQYRVHKVMARFWVANALVVTLVYFLATPVWGRASIYYLALISIYANWTGDQGAMAAADACTDEAITEHAILEAVAEGPASA
jgi:hypothetical protein